MKRLVTILLSVLLALVMCFSVIACGDKTDKDNADPNAPGIGTGEGDEGEGDNNNSDNTSTVSSEALRKALGALRKLYETDSYVASVELGLNSKLGEESNYEYELQKRGSKLALTKAGETTVYIVDVETGYLYMGNAQNGYVALSAVPADTFGYYEYVLKQAIESYEPSEGEGTGETGTPSQVKPAMPDITAQYDEATKTLTVAVDAAEYTNNTLEPLYDAYKRNKTIRALLDEYVKSNTNNTVSFTLLYEALFLMAQEQSDATFDQVNVAVKTLAPELDLYELLGEFVTMSDEVRAALASRTIGEVISGSYDYISAQIASPPTDFDVQSMAQELINAALFNPTEASPEKITQIKASMDALLGTTVKNIVNSALAENPEALAFISSSVTFNTLKSDITIKLDANDNIEKLTVKGEVEHSYTGDTEGFMFLSDNEYKLDMALDFSDYSNTHTDFEGDVTSVVGSAHAALIYGEITDSVTVYIETAGENIPSVVRANYTYGESGMRAIDTAAITIDNASSSVTIDKEFLNEVVGEANGASVNILIAFGDEYVLRIIYAGVDDVKDVTTYIVKNIMQMFD